MPGLPQSSGGDQATRTLGRGDDDRPGVAVTGREHLDAPAVVEVTAGNGSFLWQFEAVGETTRLIAVAKNTAGSVVATTFTWSSAKPLVMAVDANGVVTALVGRGSAVITATSSNNVSGEMGISVDVNCAEGNRRDLNTCVNP